MRKTVVRMLRAEATKSHPYKKLKKEYKEMKSKTNEPKFKESKKPGQSLIVVKIREARPTTIMMHSIVMDRGIAQQKLTALKASIKNKRG